MIGYNHFTQLGEPRMIPPPGTPVYYKGEIVGRVKDSVQDEVLLEIDEKWNAEIMKNFSEVKFGAKP